MWNKPRLQRLALHLYRWSSTSRRLMWSCDGFARCGSLVKATCRTQGQRCADRRALRCINPSSYGIQVQITTLSDMVLETISHYLSMKNLMASNNNNAKYIFLWRLQGKSKPTAGRCSRSIRGRTGTSMYNYAWIRAVVKYYLHILHIPYTGHL